MTTIYLTEWQYQQVLDGMVSTHLDVLDNNNDGKITQLGDMDMAVYHRQTQNIACGNTRDYVYASTDLIDKDEDGSIVADMYTFGLSHENTQALGYSSSEIDYGGELYGYNLETLNKVIDYYNNGGSWNDDDFEEHVYDGIGATGELAPESVTGTANIDGYMDNPIQNDQLMWNDGVCNSIETMLSFNGIEESEMASYTEDDQGRISTITLTSGRTLWANYDLSSDGVTASFLSELMAAGATDIKYTSDGMIASYTINGTTYNVGSEWGTISENDARSQELLASIDALNSQIETEETEKAALEAEKAEKEVEAEEQEEKVAATKKEIETNQKEVEEQTQEYKEVAFDLDDINAALEEEIELEKASAGKDSSTSKKSSLNSKVSDLTSKLSGIAKNIKFTNFNIDATQSVLKSETKTLDNINTDISAIDTQISTKDATINDLQAQLDAKVAEKASLA